MSGSGSVDNSSADHFEIREPRVDGTRLQFLTLHNDARGTLIALERDQNLPFDLKRVFFIFDVPDDQSRADHAISAHMLLVPVNGSLVIELDNGRQTDSIKLERREVGLYVEPGVLTRLTKFAPQTVLLVALSRDYASTEYFDRPFFYKPE